MTYADARVEQLRVPPQSVEAEQAVLGGLMLVPEALADVADLIKDEDFYRRDHQLIFRSIIELDEKKRPYDAVTLGEWFESKGLAEQVAGGAYLIELASTTPSAANIRAYAEIVAEKSQLRRVIEFGTETVNAGFDPNGRSAEQVTSDVAGLAAALSMKGLRDGGLRYVRSAVDGAYGEIAERYNGTIELGLAPPWADVRRKVPGLEDTDLLILAARPSMGKTAAAMEWADYAAEQGRNVAVFSLEMSRKQLTIRMLSRRARIGQELLRQKGALSDEQWAALSRAASELKALPLAIDDDGRTTIDKIRARATRMHTKLKAKTGQGLGAIVIDYLQMIEGGTGREDKRADEIAKISRGLKQLAKDLNCPVIALSQLNRSLESRPDKRPVMADLRESGAIEQDADIIIFIYRDEYYSKDKCGAPGVTEFIVAKQRNGSTGTAYQMADLACSTFGEYHGPRPPKYGKPKAAAAANDGLDDDGVLFPSGRDFAAGNS